MTVLGALTHALRTGWAAVKDIAGSRTVQALTVILVVGTLLFVWLSSYLGIDGGIAIGLIGIMLSALSGLSAIGLVFAVVVVAALIDQLWKRVGR